MDYLKLQKKYLTLREENERLHSEIPAKSHHNASNPNTLTTTLKTYSGKRGHINKLNDDANKTK